uniref:Uncharacterized protein n=1 Tax=Anguilla anguilla TaxID=7936 RepID=A0A0E9SU78_ANGAN
MVGSYILRHCEESAGVIFRRQNTGQSFTYKAPSILFRKTSA